VFFLTEGVPSVAKKSKKKKPGKVENIAKATTKSIRDAYQEFLADAEASYRGRNYEGRVALSEPLHYKRHGKLRVLIMDRLRDMKFTVVALTVERRDEADSVFFIIGRNDH